MSNLITTKRLIGCRAVEESKGKRIGKVRHFVFHPSEKRCIGFTVKRPDAALMFHRKDLFVALHGYHFDEGQIIVHSDSQATDKAAIKLLGVDWDACVIWIGMPAITQSGKMIGYVDSVTFDQSSGDVHSISIENGAANDAILGKRSVPANLIKGFRRGIGSALAPAGEYGGQEDPEAERGAILISDRALDLPVHGGAAATAGRATAIVADKAKKGAARAKDTATIHMEKAKPAAEKAARKTGEAVEAGSFAIGKQLGRASGMFSAFKDEFEKASRGEGE